MKYTTTRNRVQTSAHSPSYITMLPAALVLAMLATTASAGTFETRVTHRYCDVEEKPDGSVSRSSSDLEMAIDGTTTQVIGLCFAEINLPPGAVVTNAYIQFVADEKSKLDPASLLITGHAEADSQLFSRDPYPVSSRPATTATVVWNPDPWVGLGDAGPAQRTPNIASIIEEIVATPGWQTGNRVSLQVSGSGRRAAESFDYKVPEIAALLHIDFVGDNPNLAPEVTVGSNLSLNFPAVAAIEGFIEDDGAPVAASLRWEHVGGTGNGTVDFANSAAAATTAMISDDAGTYVLRLTADDGEYAVYDELEISVYRSGITGLDFGIYWFADDAEEDQLTGEVDRHSSDLELLNDYATGNQTAGLRFQAIDIPQGAPITAAYIQFTADETDDDATNLLITGQAANNPGTFVSSPYDISSRPRTNAAVAWSPEPWLTELERGPKQRTNDLTAIVQEIVDRGGWTPGNSMAFIVEGAGRRTTISRNNKLAQGVGWLPSEKAPTLHIEFAEPGSNRQPLVDAGEDATLLFPDSTVYLNSTASDDGLPDGTLSILWEHVGGSGTGVISFGDATALDTPVTISQETGTYVLRVTVDDGEYIATDEMTVNTYITGSITSLAQTTHTHTGFDGVGNPLAVPAIDPAGVLYHEPSGTLFIADSEINEVAPAFDIVQANLFNTNLDATSTLNQWDTTIRQGSEPSRNREPTGIAYCVTDAHFYISNDDTRLIYRYAYDGVDFTLTDWMDVNPYTTDPEGITCDPSTGRLYITGGANHNIVVVEYNTNFAYIETLDLAVTAGDPDGVPRDGEGITFDPGTGHLFLLSDPDEALFEYTTSGAFVQKWSIDGLNPQTISAQGLSIGISSSDPQRSSFYISDGGMDNDYNSDERDGMIYELEIQRVE
jgi:hypothetical protein